MGVNGLLKHLEPLIRPVHVEECYKGRTIAVDISSWCGCLLFALARMDQMNCSMYGYDSPQYLLEVLHKGAYACAVELAMGQRTDAYWLYVLHRAQDLRALGVKIICVFDGKSTKLKQETGAKRRAARRTSTDAGIRLREQAQSTSNPVAKERLEKEAHDYFRRGVEVTADMTERTIAVLRNNGFSVFVAPCEADPQLAYLCKIGVANAVMTEDSDVVVYATVTKQYFPVLLKYDHYSRQAQEIQLSPECLSSFDAAFDKQKDNRFLRGLRKLSDNLPRALAHICLLAGNDYIENVRGVGLITAAELVVLFRSIPNDKRLFRLVTHLERQRKQVPKGYFLRLQQAEVLFYYQRVYNPLTRSIEHLNPLSTKENVDPLTSSAPFVENMDLSFLTPDIRLEPSMYEICEGLRSIYTGRQIDDAGYQIEPSKPPVIAKTCAFRIISSPAVPTYNSSVKLNDIGAYAKTVHVLQQHRLPVQNRISQCNFSTTCHDAETVAAHQTTKFNSSPLVTNLDSNRVGKRELVKVTVGGGGKRRKSNGPFIMVKQLQNFFKPL